MFVVHAADLHIDSPMRGLERYPGCPVDTLRDATRRAFDHVVELCRSLRAPLLLLAGDNFDGDWKDYNSGLWFASRLRQLVEGGTQVLLVRGNHDAQSHVTRALELPAGVHLFGADAASTWRSEALGVAVHGRSFPQREVREDFVPTYPAPLSGFVNLGLLHTNVGGNAGHADYAPTTVATLLGKGYDYWALGHVHEHAVLHEAPWIVYPGNPQGRSVRELGPRGVMVLDVDTGAGRVRAVRREIVDVVRWARVTRPLGEEMGFEDAVEALAGAVAEQAEAAGGRPLAVRAELRGPGRQGGALATQAERFAAELRQEVAARAPRAWVEKVKVETWTARAAEGEAPLVGELRRLSAGWREDPEAVRALLREDLAELERLRERVAGPGGAPPWEEEGALPGFYGRAEALLAEELAGGAESRGRRARR